MYISTKDIRKHLPGQQHQNILCHFYPFELMQQVDFKGCFGEVIEISSFIVAREGIFISSHSTIEEAIQAWDTVWKVEEAFGRYAPDQYTVAIHKALMKEVK